MNERDTLVEAITQKLKHPDIPLEDLEAIQIFIERYISNIVIST